MNPAAMTRFLGAIQPAFRAGDSLADNKQLETENARRVEAAYAAISRGDTGELAILFAEDVELEIAGHPDCPMVGRWQGRDAVLAAAARNYALLDDQHPEVVSILAQGDSVALIARETGRVRATGRPYELPWLHLFTFRNGRVTRIYGFCDSHGLMQALRDA
jgi:ketosteroid isomerase-like protein